MHAPLKLLLLNKQFLLQVLILCDVIFLDQDRWRRVYWILHIRQLLQQKLFTGLVQRAMLAVRTTVLFCQACCSNWHTCMGHISIMSHLMVPSFLLL